MKVLELYFLKQLSEDNSVWQVVVSDSVSVIDTSTLTDEKRIAALKQFVSEMVLDSTTYEVSSEAIESSLRDIVDNDETIFDINKSLSVLVNNGVELLIAERDDLPAESPLEESSELKTLIVNKIIYDSKLLCCGRARGNLYPKETDDASAFDFLSFFELSSDDLKDVGLHRAASQWEILKTKKNGSFFIDDTPMISFLKSRGYDYYKMYL